MSKFITHSFLLSLVLLTACGGNQTSTTTPTVPQTAAMQDTVVTPPTPPAPNIDQLRAQVKALGPQGLPRVLKGATLPDLTEQRFGHKIATTNGLQSQGILLDHGSDGLNFQYIQGFWAAHSVDFGLELPLAPSNVSGYYIYGPTSLGPNQNCLEVLTTYSRKPTDMTTQRDFQIYNHCTNVQNWVYSIPMNDPTFKANYLYYLGGNEYSYDVAVYQSGTNADGTGQFIAALYNRRTGYWDAKATATGARNSGLQSMYPNGTGWTIFETYLYSNCPLTIPTIHEWNPQLFDGGYWRKMLTSDASRNVNMQDCIETGSNGFYFHQYNTPANEISKWLVNNSAY